MTSDLNPSFFLSNSFVSNLFSHFSLNAIRSFCVSFRLFLVKYRKTFPTIQTKRAIIKPAITVLTKSITYNSNLRAERYRTRKLYAIGCGW